MRFQLGDVPGPVTAASLAVSHTAAGGTGGRYGLGWSVRAADDGRVRVLHGGEIATWTSGIELSPDGSGAFVLTDGRGTPGALAAQLVAAAGGADPGPPPTDPMRTTDLVLLAVAAGASVLLAVVALRARRWAAARGGRRRAVSLPGVAVLAGLALLPVTWIVVVGPPSATSWLLLVWLLPTAAVLALVLVLGGVMALAARHRAHPPEACPSPPVRPAGPGGGPERDRPDWNRSTSWSRPGGRPGDDGTSRRWPADRCVGDDRAAQGVWTREHGRRR